MAKSAELNYSTRRKARLGGLMLIGIGLLLVGLVTAILLIKPNGDSDEAISADNDKVAGNSVIPAEVNLAVPSLELKDLQGQDVSLDEYQGKVILINNWATWCPPCKAEMPTLEEFYRLYKEEGFVLIAIEAGDPLVDVEKFVQSYGLSFPVWLDPQNQALQAFMNYGLPNSYVIDKKFKIRLAWTGAISGQTLEKYVTPLIQE